jgi:hypothetical protein
VTLVFTKTFREGLEEFKRATNGSVEPMMRDLLGLIVQKAYQWTPPDNRQQGRDAVAKSINRVIKSTESDKFLNMLYARFGAVTLANQEMNKRGGGKYYIRNTTIDPDGNYDVIKRNHYARRDRGQYSRVLAPDRRAKAAYIAGVQNRVGKLKAGWQGPMEELGRSVAAYIANAGAQRGQSPSLTPTRVEYQMNIDSWTGYAAAANAAPYGRDMDGRMQRAHEHVERYIASNKIENWIRQAIARHTPT